MNQVYLFGREVDARRDDILRVGDAVTVIDLPPTSELLRRGGWKARVRNHLGIEGTVLVMDDDDTALVAIPSDPSGVWFPLEALVRMHL